MIFHTTPLLYSLNISQYKHLSDFLSREVLNLITIQSHEICQNTSMLAFVSVSE